MIHVIYDLIIGKAKKSDVFILYNILPLNIRFFLKIMYPTIDLNCQPFRRAIKVDDKPFDGVLPSEFYPTHPVITKEIPE